MQEIIEQCIMDGLVVKLPSFQLDRKDYMNLKKSAEKNGGKWSRKEQGFVFGSEAQIESFMGGGNLKKEYQFFPTPKDVIDIMLQNINIIDNDIILEPSAGKGDIIKAVQQHLNDYGIKNTQIDYCELNPDMKKPLEETGFNMVGTDFLNLNKPNFYDVVIANPPFTKGQDIIHFKHMYDCCRKGGVVCSVMSSSFTFNSTKKFQEFREWLKTVNHHIIELDEGMFQSSGTNVKTVILIVEK
ncbi:hypothetical protein [uncultured Arcobacter sp.]|uniref:hypothetical protein n=1 Tax=uncultured Arcobacter sp. TaxID=165434 RepID=UPI002623C9B7|nr:hypothetical protein [uncultured Arcobacter sp.]